MYCCLSSNDEGLYLKVLGLGMCYETSSLVAEKKKTEKGSNVKGL